jgi:hypothetical protein
LGKYRVFGTLLDRLFRNNLNANFKDIDNDIKARIAEDDVLRSRIDNIVAHAGDGTKDTELIDGRQDNRGGTYTSLRAHTDAIHERISERGLSLSQFGAKQDGTDTSNTFDAIFEEAAFSPYKTIYVPDGIYGISRTLVIPRRCRVIFAPNAIIKPLTNVNVIQFKPESYLEGANIDFRDTTFSFSKAAIYLDAADIFQLYEQSHMIKDINIWGKRGTSGWTGTGILMEAKTAQSYIDNVKCRNITITNMGKGIHLRVDPSIIQESDMSWVNANMFHEITMMNFEYGIYLEGDNKIPRDVGGNIFTQLQMQAEAGTKRMIYCESALNRFDGFFWDLHKMADTNPAFEFTSTSKFNEVKSAMAQELTESWVDKGYMNSFPSPNNYLADKRVNAFPISIPYTPSFLGNQDDWLVNGDKRGYTVTQASSHPIVSGTLTDIFSFDTEAGVTFDMTNATYSNPVVLEIDISSDPCWYAAFLTAVNPWGTQPEGYELDMYNGLTNTWVGGVHWTKNNKSQTHTISAPWAGCDKATKLKIKFWGFNKPDKRVTLSRVMVTSTKEGGRAYLPYTATPTVPPPDITPYMPNDYKMAGDQDDFLLLADKRYTVNSLGATKSSGNIWGMFSMRREQFCRWTDPTQATPIIIEIDFGSNPVPNLESVGIAFAWGETPKNVKIERIIASGGAYQQVYNGTNLNQSTVHVAARAISTYKLKFTIWGVNNANTLVRINRIFATVGDDYPKTFLNTESDNKVYGDLEFMDTLKGMVMKSPDGSRWKASISNTGTLTWTKL